MVYNRKKAAREGYRQRTLVNSWVYIHNEMGRFMKDYELKTSQNQREYLINWCREATSLLRNMNKEFSRTKAERSVTLLLNRTIARADTPLYNARQLYLQSSRMI